MTYNIQETAEVENTHPLFQLKGMEEMQVTEHDKLLSMSTEAQTILMKLGVAWQETTGFQSWVDSQVVIALIKIPDETWTINRLSKWSGFGRSGIEHSLIPFMKRVGIVTEDTSGRFTRYTVTVHGREALETMVYNCFHCDNTRKCPYCETGVAVTNRWGGDASEPCNHTLTSECAECKRTGMLDCTTCDGKGEYSNWNETPETCWRCVGRGNPKGKMDCSTCTNDCDACIDNTRVKRCSYCQGKMKCRDCRSNLKLLTYNMETDDD